MTLADIRELVLAADPDACAYESDSTGEDYTTWQPLWPMNLLVDNRYADGWHFVIDRFTRMQDDPITANIRAVLDESNEKIGYKIRQAQQVDRVPYMLVLGAKEVESNNISVRDRKGETTTMDLDAFINQVVDEIKTRKNNG